MIYRQIPFTRPNNSRLANDRAFRSSEKEAATSSWVPPQPSLTSPAQLFKTGAVANNMPNGSDSDRNRRNTGTNDLGGTLMDESISRVAGAAQGQELSANAMEAMISQVGRVAMQRTTLYLPADLERNRCAKSAPSFARCIHPLGERPRGESRLRMVGRRIARRGHARSRCCAMMSL